ncbi:MAG: STAS domain-containing protein [Lachnospiraceae bacterium]|nr:STAS domain-containing protein [Lachnospiraceae bacterium]
MTVEKTKDGSELNVRVVGSVDSETAPAFRDEVMGEVEGVNTISFDLKELDYISSAGLRVFLELYKEIVKKQGKITVHNMSDEVKEVFEITGFLDIVDIQ